MSTVTDPEQMAINTRVLQFIRDSKEPVNTKEIRSALGVEKRSIDNALKWIARTKQARFASAIMRQEGKGGWTPLKVWD